MFLADGFSVKAMSYLYYESINTTWIFYIYLKTSAILLSVVSQQRINLHFVIPNQIVF